VACESPHVLIQGCAGSHKTDTLIKCAVAHLNRTKTPCLFLTMVGSVTIEIKDRLERALQITLKRKGNSNHYAGHYGGVVVCVSNMDAWIDFMLKQHNVTVGGNCFKEKINSLLALRPKKAFMPNSRQAGRIFLDEAQDLNPPKMEILLSLAEGGVPITIAGDVLQTLFYDDARCRHALNLFRRVNPAYFDLSTCFRCPVGHVDFNNFLMKDIQAKYGLPLMQASPTARREKPLVFSHYNASNATDARLTAKMTTSIISTLLDLDTTLRPGDIAVIMAKTKENLIFDELVVQLNNLYSRIGYRRDQVLHMTTETGDGCQGRLDWENAKDKTVLLSIHGDKGKGHRAVIFLGLTEGSIPRETQIGKDSELIAESLVNVALTRSTQYLIVGTNAKAPSRYLAKEGFERYAHCSWLDEGIPELYATVVRRMHDAVVDVGPLIQIKYKEANLAGNKVRLAVKADAVDVFEHPKHLGLTSECAEHEFGTKFSVPGKHELRQVMLMGEMSELLISRACGVRFPVPDRIEYSTDERVLAAMFDIPKHFCGIEGYFQDFKKFFTRKENQEAKQIIQDCYDRGVTVLHACFNCPEFKADLAAYLSPCANEELSPKGIWNSTLFLSYVRGRKYIPAIHLYMGYLHCSLEVLHDNISKFKPLLKKPQFEIETEHSALVEGDELAVLFPKDKTKKHHLVALAGRADIVDGDVLYEIKASTSPTCDPRWVIQALLYAVMLPTPIKTLVVVNIHLGVTYTWQLGVLPKLNDLVRNKIAPHFRWHPLELAAFVNRPLHGPVQAHNVGGQQQVRQSVPVPAPREAGHGGEDKKRGVFAIFVVAAKGQAALNGANRHK
jgi:hypothetical protein